MLTARSAGLNIVGIHNSYILHLPRRFMDKNVIGVDLYCGIGGSTQGMLNAGAEVVLSVDCWDVAERVHKHNFPEVPFINRRLGEDCEEDLRIVTEHILTAVRKHGGREHVHIHIHASPPCQALSNLGKKNYTDGVGAMKAILRMINILKSKHICDSWTLENVLPARKYMPDVPYQILDASDFGAHTKRRRYFAGEGWTAQKTGGALAWDEVINDPTIPEGAVLNACAHGKTISERSQYADTPQGQVMRTLTRMLSNIRVLNEDGTAFIKVRSMTIPEKLRFQGFPPSFSIPDDITKTDASSGSGNVVCPPVMEAIIKGVHRTVWL